MIYLDYAAANLITSKDAKVYKDLLLTYQGNSESGHFLAKNQKIALKDCVEENKKILNISNYNGFSFNSGTDIFNFLAFYLNSTMKKNENIVTTKLEHPAMLAAFQRLNCEVRYVEVTNQGISFSNLINKIDENSRYFIAFHVQSETGLINDFSYISQLKNIYPKIKIFADTIQSIGKIPLINADFLTCSAHKIGANNGGILWTNQKIEKYYQDYRHKYYLQSRVSIVDLIFSHLMLKKNLQEIDKNYQKVKKFNNFLQAELKKIKLKDNCKIKFTIANEYSSPYILHLLFKGYQGAILARMLSEKQIATSSGTACLAETTTPSQALKELKIAKELQFSGLRISLSPRTTKNELKIFIYELKNILDNW